MEETVTHKGIIGVFLAIVLLVSMIAGAVSPTINVHAAEDYRSWSQKDERWAATAMGGSTIRDSGCYITSIAMVAAASGARDTDSFNPRSICTAAQQYRRFRMGWKPYVLGFGERCYSRS